MRRNVMNIVIENVKDFIKRLDKHHINEFAAQCTYYTILSFIPFLMLIVTLIQYTGFSKDALLSVIQTIIPATMFNSATNIIQEVYSKSIGTISISAIFVLWSAGKGFYALSKGLHIIYETKKDNNYLRIQLKSIICTILFVVLVILVLTLSVFGDTILEFLESRFEIEPHISSIFHITQGIIYIVLFIIFLLMYRFIPGHRIKLIKHIPGALLATFGWYLLSFFFSSFIDMFKGFSIMYGSLTTITLSMMWVYFCMYILLLGAELNNFKFIKSSKNN